MTDITDVQRDLIKSAFEQHWLHARHVENERLLVVNVYALLLAGSVAAFKEKFFTAEATSAHLLLMFLAVFCALFSIKIDAIFKGHTQKADSLVQAYGLPSMLRDLVAPHWVDRRIRISRLFPCFFALCFCFLLWVTLDQHQKLIDYRANQVLPAILFLVLVQGMDRLAYDSTPRSYDRTALPRARKHLASKPSTQVGRRFRPNHPG